ncbi:DUF421 domain-containing protein [Halalkalibacter okhensis]|uniref:Membrane protein n=1 Tax=Halalkalibacter okhensis TaxID=333138 RepID=A0A0B0IBS0_9BACI|nr:DUF421 domain-containing protein [Halalkalibacter okhensis]KHF40018.1 membrane protein [Halalkalibacter okhensis]
MNETLVVIIRSIITFFTLLVYARLIGKQQIGNLTMFDYINGITIGSIAGTMATDTSSKVLNHWLALTIFIAFTLLLQITDIKNRYLSKIIDGEPVTVIEEGKILEQNLKIARLTKDELMVQLRSKNIFDLTEVEVALLEPDGTLSTLRKAEFQFVQKKDLHIQVSRAKLTTEIIVDGLLLPQNLEQRRKDLAWVQAQLDKKGIKNLKQLSYAAILPNDTLYVDLFDDHISNTNDISDYEGPY